MSLPATTSSSFVMPPTTTNSSLLDYTEIDQGFHLWSEIFPMIEKQIATLTTVAQEMQECPERQKYVDALMNIAVRVNDVEEKATACIKEARTQLKKTKFVDPSRDKIRNDDADDEELNNSNDNEENEMDVDRSHIDEQIEVSALTTDMLEKMQDQMHKVLLVQPDPATFNIDVDNRYTDFAECIAKMKDDQDDEDTTVVDQVISNKCPLTQKPFVEAVQNKKCKHKYEKKAVLKYITDRTKSKRPIQCPYAGCNHPLVEKDLIGA